jgi:hypothetical protein
MPTNRIKNSTNWMRITQFVVFCISCVLAVVIWYYSQQEKTTNIVANTYVSKTELELVKQKLDSVEENLKEMKQEFSEKLVKVEETNDAIIELVTDIRLTLARGLSE